MCEDYCTRFVDKPLGAVCREDEHVKRGGALHARQRILHQVGDRRKCRIPLELGVQNI